jgi:hypothetical protein
MQMQADGSYCSCPAAPANAAAAAAAVAAHPKKHCQCSKTGREAASTHARPPLLQVLCSCKLPGCSRSRQLQVDGSFPVKQIEGDRDPDAREPHLPHKRPTLRGCCGALAAVAGSSPGRPCSASHLNDVPPCPSLWGSFLFSSAEWRRAKVPRYVLMHGGPAWTAAASRRLSKVSCTWRHWAFPSPNIQSWFSCWSLLPAVGTQLANMTTVKTFRRDGPESLHGRPS